MTAPKTGFMITAEDKATLLSALSCASYECFDNHPEYEELAERLRAVVVYQVGELFNASEGALSDAKRPIDAVVAYRKRTGAGLREAKDALDTYRGVIHQSGINGLATCGAPMDSHPGQAITCVNCQRILGGGR